ncbi:MAG: DUF1287 domain-containing protein [Acidobacteriota bacterium]
MLLFHPTIRRNTTTSTGVYLHMHRREFLTTALAFAAIPTPPTSGERLATAARQQLGVTKTYDPHYTHLPYPNGDVPRSTGVCADVIVRAGRDALSLDLQKLIHEDIQRNFAAYPHTWNLAHPDASIDHRRVLNLEAYFRRTHCQLWSPTSTPTAGNAFPTRLLPGDILTWLLDARLPHIGIVVANNLFSTRVVHNWGNGAEDSPLSTFSPHRAHGHFRWPSSTTT